jgi:nitroreductase
MDYFELIQKRHSVREYQSKLVEKELVEQILNAACCAPSAGNLQAYEIYVIEDEARRKALVAAARDQEFLRVAPLVLVFCAHPARSEWKYHQRGVDLYAVQDASIACTFAMLAAANLGLGSVWVGAFNDEAVMQILGNPEGLRPVAILPIGYPAVEPAGRPRRSLTDLVHGWEAG